MSKNYTLIGTPLARPFRVVWAMEEMGLPYEIQPAPPQSEEIRMVNPSGKVPALIDHQAATDAISDSVAIIQYLADKHQQLTFQAGTIERARQDSFTQFACDEMDSILWITAKHTFVLPEHLRHKEGVKTAATWDFARAMKVFEQRLGANQYVMGDTFTVPDIILGHCAGWANRAGFELPDGSVGDYFYRLAARPAFKRASELREQYQ